MKSKFPLIVLLVACAGCAGPGNISLTDITSTFKDAQEATKEVTEAEEIELGQAVASNLLGAMPLYQNQKVQQYVNNVGRWLASQTERPNLPWHFAVVDDNSLNAFATPGGNIFITSGLLRRMRNEAELAGVLSHEISHVVKKHHLQAIQAAARSRGGKNLLNRVVAQKVNNGIASAVVQNMIGAYAEVYTKGLDKGEEFEADRMGIVIAARGGYDPYGLPAVLQMLDTFSPQDANASLLFETHPLPKTRLSLLDKIMSPALDRFEKQPNLEPRFKTTMGIPPPKK